MRKYINLGILALQLVSLVYVGLSYGRVNKIYSEFSELQMNVENIQEQVDSVRCHLETPKPAIVPKKKKVTSTFLRKGTFYGFDISEPVDTSVTSQLKLALETYCGPQVRINSLKRHYNKSSQHYHGKAVDLEFCSELIEHLLSEDGQIWLKSHGLAFFIEGRPGSRKVKEYAKYDKYKPYIFFNAAASGNHIHLYAKV